MHYKITRYYSYTMCCEIEADSAEEAKKLSEDAEWEEDDGGETYLENEVTYVAIGDDGPATNEEFENGDFEYEEID